MIERAVVSNFNITQPRVPVQNWRRSSIGLERLCNFGMVLTFLDLSQSLARLVLHTKGITLKSSTFANLAPIHHSLLSKAAGNRDPFVVIPTLNRIGWIRGREKLKLRSSSRAANLCRFLNSSEHLLPHSISHVRAQTSMFRKVSMQRKCYSLLPYLRLHTAHAMVIESGQ